MQYPLPMFRDNKLKSTVKSTGLGLENQVLVNLYWMPIAMPIAMKGISKIKMPSIFQTRAPRGTDRSPEYNEQICYKLDSRVKNLTTEWNQKQQHFLTHASRSLLWIRFVAVAFRSEEETFWRRGTPPPSQWPILPRPGSAPGQIWPKHLFACARPWARHPYQVS